MLIEGVAAILDRDLQALGREVMAYPDDDAIWQLPEGAPNSAGTLVLHLAGNVQHFLGARLGGTAFVRDRPAEFSARGLPRAALLSHIEAARGAVRAAAKRLEDDAAGQDFPDVVGGVRVTVGEFLVHLVSHFAYHLGQLDYHRRLVTRDSRGVDVLRVTELASARPVPD
jgi:uncharacterized damage-inducible protein DinB